MRQLLQPGVICIVTGKCISVVNHYYLCIYVACITFNYHVLTTCICTTIQLVIYIYKQCLWSVWLPWYSTVTDTLFLSVSLHEGITFSMHSLIDIRDIRVRMSLISMTKLNESWFDITHQAIKSLLLHILTTRYNVSIMVLWQISELSDLSLCSKILKTLQTQKSPNEQHRISRESRFNGTWNGGME